MNSRVYLDQFCRNSKQASDQIRNPTWHLGPQHVTKAYIPLLFREFLSVAKGQGVKHSLFLILQDLLGVLCSKNDKDSKTL